METAHKAHDLCVDEGSVPTVKVRLHEVQFVGSLQEQEFVLLLSVCLYHVGSLQEGWFGDQVQSSMHGDMSHINKQVHVVLLITKTVWAGAC